MEAQKARILSTTIAITFIIAIGFILRLGSLIHGAFIDSESQMSIQPMQDIILNQPYSYNESKLLLGITLVPYYALGGLLSLYQIIFLIHTLFLILSFLLVYLFTWEITKHNKASLFAVAILAVMPTAVQTQSFANYIGDFFVPVLVLLSLYLLIKGVTESKSSKSITYLTASVAIILFANVLWNGGFFGIVVFAIAILAIILERKIGSKNMFFIILLGIPLLFLIYYANLFTIPNTMALSNVNAYSPNGVLQLNIMTFFTQLDQVLYPPTISISLYLLISILAFFLFTVPTLIALILIENKNIWLLTISIMLIVGLPIALFDARFESLIILPIAILAGVGTEKIKIPFKIQVYAILILIMIMLSIIEVWSSLNYY